MTKKSPAHSKVTWPFLGQERLGSLLIALLDQQRLPAVLSFFGPAHLGKASGAQWLAQYGLCTAATRPCGVCPSCRQVMADQHPQCTVLGRSGETISIDDVRQATARWSTKAVDREHRWLLILDADHLSEGASNALLKFLEELPAQTTVILSSSHPEDVPATVRSRTTSWLWHLVPHEQMETWLPKAMQASAPSLRRAVLDYALGRPGLVMNMPTDDQVGDMVEMLRDPLPAVRQPIPEQLSDRLAIMSSVIRDALLATAQSDRRRWTNRDDLPTLVGTRSLSSWLAMAERAVEYTQQPQPSRLSYYDLLVA